jgi:uncharacterized protein (TIGR03663 family)
MKNYLKKHWFIILFIAIVILGAFFRFFLLDLKPMHHDEGEETILFIKPLLNHQPLTWDYDNKGLFYQYLSVIAIKVLGYSTFALRFTPALFGVFTIILLFFLKNFLGKAGVIFSSLFLAISPLFIYYSRQYTSWPFLDFFLLFLIITFLFYLKTKNTAFFYALFVLLGICLNIVFEATVLFLIFFSFFLYFNFLLDKDFKEKAFGFLKAKSIRQYIWAFLLFGFVAILIQSSFFTNFINITSFPEQIIKLVGKAVNTGHNKGLFYYFTILYPYELGLLIFSFLGFFFYKKDYFSKFLICWTFFAVLFFSLLSYKTNWTMYYIFFPLVLLAGNTFDFLYNKYHKLRKILIFTVLILFVISLTLAIDQNYLDVNNYDFNKIGYVETTPDIFRLIKDIEDYQVQNTSKILITASSYWPLPVFLDQYSPWYLGDISKLNFVDYPDYNIFIANNEQLESDWPGFDKKVYELRRWYYLTVLFKKM